jgi:hypothetical protein
VNLLPDLIWFSKTYITHQGIGAVLSVWLLLAIKSRMAICSRDYICSFCGFLLAGGVLLWFFILILFFILAQNVKVYDLIVVDYFLYRRKSQ